MKTSAPLFNAIVNNALFHSNSRYLDAASNQSHAALLSGIDSLPQIL